MPLNTEFFNYVQQFTAENTTHVYGYATVIVAGGNGGHNLADVIINNYTADEGILPTNYFIGVETICNFPINCIKSIELYSPPTAAHIKVYTKQ